jgi:hypothetical protein
VQETETDHFANRIMELLEEHIPATQKEAFMARLSSIMESLGDRHPARISTFNEVHKRLHAENQRR